MRYFVACLLVFCISGAFDTPKNSASANNFSGLEGTWQLNYITGPRIVFDELYPDNKPTITFDIKKKKVVGNTGCNSFSTSLTTDGKKIKFTEPVILTKKSCSGEGEATFLVNLKKADGYDMFAGYTLSLSMGDTALMRFTRVTAQ